MVRGGAARLALLLVTAAGLSTALSTPAGQAHELGPVPEELGTCRWPGIPPRCVEFFTVERGSGPETRLTGVALSADALVAVGTTSETAIALGLDPATGAERWKRWTHSGDWGGKGSHVVPVGERFVLVGRTAELEGAWIWHAGVDGSTGELAWSVGMRAPGLRQADPRAVASLPGSRDLLVAGFEAETEHCAPGLNGYQWSCPGAVGVVYRIDGETGITRWRVPLQGPLEAQTELQALVPATSGEALYVAGSTIGERGRTDPFIARIEASTGQVVWSRVIEADGFARAGAFSLSLDASGDRLFAASLARNPDLTVDATITSLAGTSGETLWTETIPAGWTLVELAATPDAVVTVLPAPDFVESGRTVAIGHAPTDGRMLWTTPLPLPSVAVDPFYFAGSITTLACADAVAIGGSMGGGFGTSDGAVTAVRSEDGALLGTWSWDGPGAGSDRIRGMQTSRRGLVVVGETTYPADAESRAVRPYAGLVAMLSLGELGIRLPLGC